MNLREMIGEGRIGKGLYWGRSWKLIEGCSPLSPACLHCWSARETVRMARHPNPKIWRPKAGLNHPDGAFNGQIRLRHDNLYLPLQVKKPTAWSVWNDLFHEDVEDDFIFQALAVMALAHQHFFFVLTKRAKRMREFFEQKYVWALIEGSAQRIYHDETGEDPSFWLAVHSLPNVIGMVTAENQEMADLRIPDLLATPWSMRGISIEGMLGPVDIAQGLTYRKQDLDPDDTGGRYLASITGIDWVVAGGESGPEARPTHPDWLRSVRDQCKAAGVPFFFKGWGEWLGIADCIGSMCGKPRYERPGVQMYRVGHKHSGHLLDGKEYRELPEGA